MWPSQATAARVYDLANVALVVAVVLGVVATLLVLWMGNVKEGYLRRDLGEANSRVEAARAETGKAHEAAAGWERDAAEAQLEQQRLRKLSVELHARNLVTEMRLEKERAARLQTEKVFGPRILEQRQSAKELEPFRGVSVIIESLADAEPWRLAGQIAWTVQQAQWTVLPGMRRCVEARGFFDGVTVATNLGALPADDKSVQAGDALAAVLRKNNIAVRRMPPYDPLPPHTLLVRIGLKPTDVSSRGRSDLAYGNTLYK